MPELHEHASCPTCGSPVRYATSTEGTGFFYPSPLEGRVAELEAALHQIASSTYNVQYETAQPAAVVQYASSIHRIARAAVEPPQFPVETKGDDHDGA